MQYQTTTICFCFFFTLAALTLPLQGTWQCGSVPTSTQYKTVKIGTEVETIALMVTLSPYQSEYVRILDQYGDVFQDWFSSGHRGDSTSVDIYDNGDPGGEETEAASLPGYQGVRPEEWPAMPVTCKCTFMVE